MPDATESDLHLTLDRSGRLAQSLPCVRCGYDLRGLAPHGACPECGEEIARSAQSDRLRFANANWVRRLVWGHWMMLWGGILQGANVGYGFRTPHYELIFYLICWAVPAVAVIVGTFWLTSTEPHAERRVPTRNARWALRAFIAFSLLAEGWAAIWQSQHLDNPLPVTTEVMLQLLLAGLVVAVAAFYGQLSERLKQPVIASRLRLASGIFLAGVAATLPLAVGQLVVRGTVESAVGYEGVMVEVAGIVIESPLAYAALPFQLAALVSGIWIVVLLFRFGGALKREAQHANKWSPFR